MLFWCWASVGDGGPTVKQHWVYISGIWDHPRQLETRASFHIVPTSQVGGQQWSNFRPICCVCCECLSETPLLARTLHLRLERVTKAVIYVSHQLGHIMWLWRPETPRLWYFGCWFYCSFLYHRLKILRFHSSVKLEMITILVFKMAAKFNYSINQSINQ